MDGLEALFRSPQWIASQGKEKYNALEAMQNHYAMRNMAQNFPEKRHDLWEIYQWYMRQRNDQELNNAQFSRTLQDENLKRKEYERLFGKPAPNKPLDRWM